MNPEQHPEVVLFYRPFVDLLDGDILAALMLSQIFYWYKPGKNGQSKLKKYKHGKWWLAKSVSHWQAELGLTPKQSRRALAVLEARGLIETCIMRFEGHGTTHLRFAFAEGRQVFDTQQAVLAAISCSSSMSSGAAPVPSEATLLCPAGQSNNIDYSESTTQTTNAIAGQSLKDIPVNAKDILNKFNQSGAQTKATGVNAMALAWKKELGLSGSGFVKALTAKEVGQLKHVHNQLGPTAVEVMVWAVRNWSKFSNEVSVAKGVPAATSPTPGWFCQHFEVAVQLIAQPAPAVTTPPQPPVVLAKPVKHNPEPDNEPLPDLASTLELFKPQKE